MHTAPAYRDAEPGGRRAGAAALRESPYAMVDVTGSMRIRRSAERIS
jgi:hypothetical protein